jgi:2-keto-4-pentenoate hydratase/2-oxohepta-3-ene-1,7-dioic acid hydratase in catechol pathway
MLIDYVRYESKGAAFWGLLEGDEVFKINGSVYDKWARGESVGSKFELKLLPPCEPRIVIGLAYNYKDLVGKKDVYEEPLAFLKAPTCVISAADKILRPINAKKVWIETELAIVLKRSIFKATAKEAEDSILGYVIANDITAENVHGRDHHLARSKSLPSFCPVGDVLRSGIDTGNLGITTVINGLFTQRGSTIDRIYNDIQTLVFLSSLVPLNPGDLVLTGTPAGAMDSLINEGDAIQMNLDNIGSLSNPIISR